VLRRGLLLGAVVVLVMLAASLAFAVGTLSTRPLENTEGCLLFEAARVRAGLVLYTDPVAGAFDYGPVPARYYVLYPPLWAFLLSLWPANAAPVAGRVLSLLAWYGVLFWIARGAYRRRRPLGVLTAVFVGGVYTLTLYGASARPDALAVALAGAALEGLVRAQEASSRGGALAGLFALAAWLKPNVLGLGAGAMLSLARTPRRALGALFAVVLVSAPIVVVLHLVSRGAFWQHLARATLQPLCLSQWLEQAAFRFQFLALPILFALGVGIAQRGDAGVRTATFALASSLAWTLVSAAKVGSTTSYWMEPCLGACVVLAHAPPPSLSPRTKSVLALLVPLQAVWTGVGSVRSSVGSIVASPGKARAIEALRRCLRGGSLYLSDDAGIELALDGRLVDTPFQTTALIRAGRFPRELWVADVERPEIAGAVASSDILERSLAEVDVAHDRYDVEMRRVLADEFVFTSREAGFYVYGRRPEPVVETGSGHSSPGR